MNLQFVFNISLVLFIVGNLLNMGLGLKLREAVAGLRNVRFVIVSLLCGFVLCPAFAYIITKIVPLAEPYAVGLILLGMVPSAPFFPLMVGKAKGDMGYTAAFMLLAIVATVIYMPIAVPVMVKGLTADAWGIAKPLLFLLLVPLVIGMAIRSASAPLASTLHSFVRNATKIATVVMLTLVVIIYGKGFIGAIGTYAIGAQILFFSAATVAAYGLGFGLPRDQRSVLTLGICTRNPGAALAPLLAVQGTDERAIIMVVLCLPMQIIFAFLVARWFRIATIQ